VDKAHRQLKAMNQNPRAPTPSERVQLLSKVARWYLLSTRDSVVGSGSIDVGKKGPARKPGRRTVESLARPDGFPELRIDGSGPPQADGAKAFGAMSQQQGDGGNVSAPQKFVQLVGCHDPGARTGSAATGSWVRPRPVPPKR
jgi:hypothetical protein